MVGPRSYNVPYGVEESRSAGTADAWDRGQMPLYTYRLKSLRIVGRKGFIRVEGEVSPASALNLVLVRAFERLTSD